MALTEQQRNNRLVMKLIGMAAGMFVFGFVILPPLYDALCEVTGIGGKVATTAADVADQTPLGDRTVTVEFVATLNEYAPWEFEPAVASMTVRPGEMYATTYFAQNLTDREITGQAVPSIAPGQAAKYLQKTECFCFTSQLFAAQEGRDMPLRFVVDPDIPDYIDRVTLSYTFFVAEQAAQN